MRSKANNRFKQRLENERGIILILGLWMLLLLTVLGAFATSTSMTEISIAGNYRNAETALSAADAGIAWAETNGAIYSTIGTGTWPTLTPTSTVAVGGDSAEVNVTYISSGYPPAGSNVDPTYFGANYFVITSTGTGRNNSQARIESQVAKIVPLGS